MMLFYAIQILLGLFLIVVLFYRIFMRDFPFTPSKYIKTNLEVLLKMLDGEDLKQYKEMILFKDVQQMFFLSDSKVVFKIENHFFYFF